MIDLDRYENTAAWLEFCDGMTRFAAETEAARRQGYQRHEVQNEIRNRNIASARHHGSALVGKSGEGNLSELQPHAAQEAGRVPEYHANAGGDSGELLALRMGNGGIV